MKRRLLNLLTVLSLLLCVAVCMLWVRSYWVGDVVRHVAPGRSGVRERCWQSSRGRVGWTDSNRQYLPGDDSRAWWASEPYPFGYGGLSRRATSPPQLGPWGTLGFFAESTSAVDRVIARTG